MKDHDTTTQQDCNPQPTLISLVPKEILQEISNCKVLELGFGAGPSCCAGKVEICSPVQTLEQAERWLEHYRQTFRRAHVYLSDTSTLCFDSEGFLRRSTNFDVGKRRPGITMKSR